MTYAFPLIALAGTAGGLLFHWLHVPGGPMFGAVLAVLAVKLLPHSLVMKIWMKQQKMR